MVLLDTYQHPERDRREIERGSLKELAGSAVEPPGGDASNHVRLRAWDVGDGCRFFTIQGRGVRVRRLSSRFSSSATPNISSSIQAPGHARFSQTGQDELASSGGMYLAEMTEVYTWQSSGSGDGATFQIPLEVMDVPPPGVKNAAQQLIRRPVNELARQHLLTLSCYNEAFAPPQSSARQPAIHLLRAPVKSFSTDQT